MGIPSSLPTNPNPSPSPPLPQSPPPQMSPPPQSPPSQTLPLPPGQTPTLIPPTPLSPQTEQQNETPIFETQFPKPIPESAPTQTKSKGKTKKAAGRPKKAPVGKRKRAPSVPFDLNSPPQPSSEPVSKRTRSSSQIPPPAVQTPVSQSRLNSPTAPVSSANNIEELLPVSGESYRDGTMLLHMDVCEKVGNTYALLQQHPEASGTADPTTFAPAKPQLTTALQFSADILSPLRSLESKIASFTVQPSVPSPDTTDILATLKSLEVKIDTMASDHNEPTAGPEADPDVATKP
ncbi:proline-rich receptor-like protein kinase PERK13 [Hevea brasiliensis]|uniref:proline-rich receptor-like protein kinase PERK13 n=1 Tax=Hevea brasiliensis TaxID=3981 RepID=UPI0025D56037|nr:proline-rich receptor-like protein kinase PERK13 [Hevea brasiliensis]